MKIEGPRSVTEAGEICVHPVSALSLFSMDSFFSIAFSSFVFVLILFYLYQDLKRYAFSLIILIRMDQLEENRQGNHIMVEGHSILR